MTPQEKAVDLIEKFKKYSHADWDDNKGFSQESLLYNAQECALLAVKEILKEVCGEDNYKHWQQVKEEIEKF